MNLGSSTSAVDPAREPSRAAIRLLACLALSIFAAARVSRAEDPRPRIGLVLEGGGALGIAHVGVLKVLEEERVPVDIITGTSMGSIVGAAYASGQTIEEMEEVLASTDWDALFLEEPERKNLPFRLKPGRNREIYGAAKVGLNDGNLVFPMALIEGQRVLPLFQRLFDNAPYPQSFDDLPVRYRAVAADIETGEAVVLGSGDLARSARASMAVPGVFAPMELDGRLLVDGAIRNNFPVDVAKDMGADVIIGSYFEYEFRKRDELKNPLSILGQMLDFLLAETSERNLKLLGPDDVRITPDVRKFTTSSFDQAKAIMEAGEAAARKAVPALRRFSVSESEFRLYRERRTRRGLEPEIDFVRIVNHSSLPDSLIARQVRTVPGGGFDRKTLEEDVERIHNVGNLREVRYELIEDGNERGVVLHIHEKEWVERYVRVGFAVEDNFEGDSNYSLGLSLRTNNATPMGGYTELDAEIGKTPGISGELYQPITESRRFFVAPFLAYGERPVFVRQGGETLAEYRRSLGFADLDLGASLGSYGEATIGLRRGFGELEREVGDEALPEFSFDVGEARAEIVLDKLDQPDFPRSGFLARLSERSALEELGASDSFDQLAGNATLPISFGPNTLLFRTDFGVTFDRLPVEQSFALGGFLDISGFLQGELTASDYVVGTAAYYHRLTRAGSALFGADLLAGASVEMASLRSDIPAIPDNSSILAGSIFLGSDTTLIPVYLAFGLNDDNEESFYLVFGRLRPARR